VGCWRRVEKKAGFWFGFRLLTDVDWGGGRGENKKAYRQQSTEALPENALA